jgi:DNA-binding protein YbaB
MGVFKSMRDLQKQAKQIEATMPPVADRMAAAQARMAAANQMMAAQTQAANAAVAAAAGTAGAAAARRTVTITGMRQVGMINFDPLVQFDLTVLPDGLPPYPGTTQQRVSQMQIGRLQPGVTLQASVDPSNPAAIWLDLESVR